MKISSRTAQVLKNFSTINQSLLFKPGKVLTTISPQKTVLAKAIVDEEFDKQFAIFDLSRFLGVMSLFNEPEIKLEDKFATIKDNNQKVNYTYADPSMIVTPPDKNINMQEAEISFTLTSDSLARVTKAMAVLQTPEIAVVGVDSNIFIETFDSKNATSDNFSVLVGTTKHTFKMVFKVDNIKLMPGDYQVKISSKGIGHFSSNDVEYWITTEASSTFK